jgi:NADH-quinone oxidoreductase subunit G
MDLTPIKGMWMAQISIDGKWIEAESGRLLIEILNENAIDIPHFCYHPALGKDGNCRMCMVEVEGKKRPQIACDTPVSDGMVVRTTGESIDATKRAILELELINHPIDCPICDQAGECKLQDFYMDVGCYESRLRTSKVHGKKHVDLGANVILDQERCVLCTRCVRFLDKIRNNPQLGVFGRGDSSVIDCYPGAPLDDPYAMNVIELCPVGALTSKIFRFKKRVWFLKSYEGICPGCSKGCNIYIDHHKAKYEKDKIYRVRPRFNQNVNGYFMCDAGRMLIENINEFGTYPMINDKKSTYAQTVAAIQESLKIDNSTILLGASLSLEEMWLGKTLGSNVKVAASNESGFKDDYLKEDDRESNRAGAKALGLEFANNIEDISISNFVLMIGLSKELVLYWIDKCKKAHIPFGIIHQEQISAGANWFLPMPYHWQRAGHYINCQGYVQFSDARLENEEPSLLEILLKIKNSTQMDVQTIFDKFVAPLLPKDSA